MNTIIKVWINNMIKNDLVNLNFIAILINYQILIELKVIRIKTKNQTNPNQIRNMI